MGSSKPPAGFTPSPGTGPDLPENSAPRLLATKYRLPVRRRGLIVRARLLETLDRAAELPLTLVSAPAGFGKSSLLVEWAAGREAAVAWVSLDAGDSDAGRFLEYLSAALQRVFLDRPEAALGLLEAPLPADSETVLSALINALADAGRALTLVLDDYHLAESPGVDAAATFLVEHLPPGVHLVISTRWDPALPLARWRAKGLLTEIRAADLRFTVREAEDFLRGTAGPAIGEDAAAILTERSEGWAAGLQMAAQALVGHDDPDGFIRHFAGSHRYVLDYLMEEVLSSQSAAVRDFLLRTSVLERLSGSLCEAVTGQPGGLETLRSLSRRGLFVEALDDEDRWFRYQRLFADLLAHLLHVEHPELEPELHRRASLWYERAGWKRAAAEHALRAGDLERAADLAQALAESALSDADFRAFAGWVEALPEGVLESRPRLCALLAVAQFYAGRSAEQVERALARAEGPQADPEAQGTAAALRAIMGVIRGDEGAGREHAERALSLLPSEQPFLRVMAGTSLGLAALHDGDPDLAERAFRETLRAAEAGGSLVLRALAARRLGSAASLRGDLHEAEARFRQILEFTTGPQGRRHPLAGLGLAGLGQVLRERGELDEAEALLREGLELTRRLGPPFTLDALAGLARVLEARGDFRAAAAALGEAAAMAERFDVTDTDDAFVAALTARLHLAEGDLEGAARWATARAFEPEAAPSPGRGFYPEEMERTTLARLLLRSNRPEDALAQVEALLPRAAGQGRLGSVIELETLRALALDASGASRPAMTALARAVDLAAAHGHLRVFLDEGEPLATLLRRGVSEGVLPSHARTVLAAFGASPPRRGPPGLRQPLTGREQRVLRLLAGPLSVPEIARELYVAPSTVRTHLKAIYRKLGVSRRAAAVDRARRLQLL